MLMLMLATNLCPNFINEKMIRYIPAVESECLCQLDP